MTNTETDVEVIFEVKGGLGLITLNRPRALNSLTHTMIVMLQQGLDAWAIDDQIKAVAIVGAGEKAFCAGGDVVKVVQSYQAGTGEWRDFFHDEYLLNMTIESYPKPYISFVDGITMGGGVGVSVTGDYWVATEKTLFAMPEADIGLFPDVGGGWFLPRLPGEVGMYLALTCARMKTADLFAIGLATHVMKSAEVNMAVDALAQADIKSHKDVKAILDGFHTDPEPAPIARHLDMIDRLFSGFGVEDIISGLEQDGSDWAAQQAKVLKQKSPMSLKLTFEQLKRGAGMANFAENMIMEFTLVNHIMRGHDFFEGVRAVLIDKDQAPVWSPRTLEDISEGNVAAHFEPLNPDQQLKMRAN